jgi:hypothetical protein
MCIIFSVEIIPIFPLILHKNTNYNPFLVHDPFTSVKMQKFIYFLFVMSYYAVFSYNERNERNARPFACDVHRISERFQVQRRTGDLKCGLCGPNVRPDCNNRHVF